MGGFEGYWRRRSCRWIYQPKNAQNAERPVQNCSFKAFSNQAHSQFAVEIADLPHHRGERQNMRLVLGEESIPISTCGTSSHRIWNNRQRHDALHRPLEPCASGSGFSSGLRQPSSQHVQET